jgi:hypothetical protein
LGSVGLGWVAAVEVVEFCGADEEELEELEELDAGDLVALLGFPAEEELEEEDEEELEALLGAVADEIVGVVRVGLAPLWLVV